MQYTPETPRELLTLMASTSTQVDVFSDGVIESVKRGEINPLTVLIQLRAMKMASERILKEINPELMNEADKYPGKEFEFAGNRITKSEHGTKYDYAATGDPVYKKLFEDSQWAAFKLKERETFLKAITEPFTMVDEETGETVTVRPPVKKSTSGLNVSIR